MVIDRMPVVLKVSLSKSFNYVTYPTTHNIYRYHMELTESENPNHHVL